MGCNQEISIDTCARKKNLNKQTCLEVAKKRPADESSLLISVKKSFETEDPAE